MSKKIDRGLGNLEGYALEARLYELLEAAGKESASLSWSDPSPLRAGFVILKHAKSIGAKSLALVSRLEEVIPLSMRSQNFQDALARWYIGADLERHLNRILAEAGEDRSLQKNAGYVILRNAGRMEAQQAREIVEKVVQMIAKEDRGCKFEAQLDQCLHSITCRQAEEDLTFLYDHELSKSDKEARLLAVIQDDNKEILDMLFEMVAKKPLGWSMSKNTLDQVLARMMDFEFALQYDVELFRPLFSGWEDWFEWVIGSFERIFATNPEFPKYIGGLLREALETEDEYIRALALFHLYEQALEMPNGLRRTVISFIANRPEDWRIEGFSMRLQFIELFGLNDLDTDR